MIRNGLIGAALALAAIAGGMLYFAGDSTDSPAAAPAAQSASVDASARSETAPSLRREETRRLRPDARLAALQVSPDNDLIQFVVGENDKVIAEIDQDPASPGFGKRTREYSYSGDRIVAVTTYRYMKDQVEITRTLVAYAPDGSVEQIRETTSYASDEQLPR
jgi:hypothetical protein